MSPQLSNSCLRLSSDGDLNLNAGLDVDDDLLDDLGGGVQVDEALVNAHLVGVPGLGTLTARGLTGGDLEVLGGQTDGALDAEVLALGTVDELGADLLEALCGVRSRIRNTEIERTLTLRLVRVMRILWILGPSKSPPFSGLSVHRISTECTLMDRNAHTVRHGCF